MKILDISSEYSSPIALSLGFFDCIHLGHRALISAAKKRASELGAECAVLTYLNDVGAYFGAEKQIYTFDERMYALDSIGVDAVIAARFDAYFADLPAEEFFKMLTDKFSVASIFVGADHTFGKGGAGNVDLLSKLCASAGIELNVVPFELCDGAKISTSSLRSLVKSGNIVMLNALLGAPYMIAGRVVSNRRVGRSIGFPTANIPLSAQKLALRSGIYAATLTIDGKTYRGMTNVGGKPTFGVSEPTIETYLFDFDGDLYDKDVLLRLYARTRDVKAFASAEDLKAQLSCDEREIRALLKQLLG